MKTIALVGGGTAGHIMPNLALIPYLKKHFDKVIYLGSYSAMEERICKSKNIPYFPMKTMKFYRKKIWKNAALPFVLKEGVKEAKRILTEQGVNLLFSKGGYASVPAVIAARKLKIPVVCHESDRTMGLANRFAARRAARVYTAFPNTRKGAEILATPIRNEIFQGKKMNLFKDPSKPTLLFMGGSLGAEAINDALSQNFADLSDKFNVLHIAGGSKLPVKTPSYYCVPFTDNIPDFFQTADLVVCRAGASTLGELTALGKRVIAIPLPKGESRGDQEENAAYYLAKGQISVLAQSTLPTARLAATIEELIKKRPPAPAYDRRTPELLAEQLYQTAFSS